MFARSRSQLRLLISTAMAVAMFVLPGAAQAATPVCDGSLSPDGSYYYSAFTSTDEARTQSLSVTVTCTDPDVGTPGGPMQQRGSEFGQASFPGHTGTLNVGGANSDGAFTLTWNPDDALVNAENAVSDYYILEVNSSDGVSAPRIVNVAFDVIPEADLSTVLTAPATLDVPAAGATTTLTTVVTNLGPNKGSDTFLNWTFPTSLEIVGSSVDDPAATCTKFDGEAGASDQFLYCSDVTIPNGTSRTFTATVKYVPGVKGLVLPSTSTITVDTSGRQSGGNNSVDRNAANDRKSASVALRVAPTQTTNPTGGCTPGKDVFIGTAGDDVFDGCAGDDEFAGNAGDDRFNGGAGNDVGYGNLGADFLNGGADNDRLYGGSGPDKMFGGAGNDKLWGESGTDLLNGGSGNDVLRGGFAADTLICGAGRDRAFGNSGNDIVLCRDGAGGDVLYGGTGRDTCIGDPTDVYVGCERILRF